ncbi:MAG: hypothetical protein ACC635_04690 [Acidiferrobacterales bacterium]
MLLVLVTGMTIVVSAQAKDDDHEWRITKDPFYGDALFYYSNQQYFSAITRLLAGRRMGRLGAHKEEAELLLGGMYLSYGMHNKATTTFDRLLNKKTVTPKIRDRALFYLGKIRYQRGYTDEAEVSLQSVGKALPAKLQEEHAVLLANILMSKGEYKKAVEILKDSDNKTAWSAYGKYNMGIALIRLGQQKRGIALLESVGDMKAKNEEMKSLRDKANTALGYNFLKENKPDKALSFLNDVRLDGLLANKALLGTGWAYSSRKEYKKALVYWTELQKRDVIDSAVQESLLAVPYSLASLGAGEQAKKHYREAIAIYEAEQQRLNYSMQAIRSGKLIKNIRELDASDEKGWFYALNSLPKSSESRYLINLMSGHAFQEALKNYRDVRFLQQYLKKQDKDLSAYDWMVAARKEGYESRLPYLLKNFMKLDSGYIQKQRNVLAKEIKRIEKTQDIWALANEKEKALVKKINTTNKKISHTSKTDNVDDLKNKMRILKGALAWRLQTQFVKRLWSVKASLKELDKAIAESERAKAVVKKAKKQAPATFNGFNSRLRRYKQAIGQLRARSSTLADAQAKYIERLAIRGLQKQQQRLGTYLTQARFGIVQILDKDIQAK